VSSAYAFARSLCEAVAWNTNVLSACVSGTPSASIDERCAELGIGASDRSEVLLLAFHLASAVSEREHSFVRVLSSQPRLVAGADRYWAVGQEWLELIRRAERRIIIVSPSLDEAAARNCYAALSAAATTIESFAIVHGRLGRPERINAALGVYASAFPGAEILEWPSSEHGFLHAKLICVDVDLVYMGSANVTEYGWEKNVEVGVTLKGPAAGSLVRYCEGLLEIARSAQP